MLDVNKEFRPDSKSIHDFFQEPGQGFTFLFINESTVGIQRISIN